MLNKEKDHVHPAVVETFIFSMWSFIRKHRCVLKIHFQSLKIQNFFYVFSQLSLVSRFWRILKKSLLRKNSIYFHKCTQQSQIWNYQTPPALRFLCKPLLFLVAQTVNWKFVVSVAQKHSFRGLVITYDATARIFGGDPFSKLRSLLLWKCSNKREEWVGL